MMLMLLWNTCNMMHLVRPGGLHILVLLACGFRRDKRDATTTSLLKIEIKK